MDTKKIVHAISGGFIGFLILLCAEGILFLAFIASFKPFENSSLSLLSWFLIIVVVLPLIILASTLPAIFLSHNKKASVISGITSCILTIIISTHPFQESRGIFDMTDTFAYVILIGIPMLTISFNPSENRKRRIGILLGVWAVFLILGMVIASFSQIGGGVMALLTWLVLPAVTSML